ncbi:MAG: hypothetical protein HYY05_07200 [Chloroflexi bacterium]|nr:hypothetical protein [Chloroflexota bacterium]
MSQPRTLRVRIQRFDPARDPEPYERTYEVPFEEGISVTNVLYRINEISGEAVAYRVSCHRGICASCLMRVNGHPELGCCTEVRGDLVLEPAFKDKVIKDLVVEQH